MNQEQFYRVSFSNCGDDIYLTDNMVMCDDIHDAVEACDRKFLIINKNANDSIEWTDIIEKFTPEIIHRRTAIRPIYCREITLNRPKTLIAMERFTVKVRGVPIEFLFDLEFLYGKTKKCRQIQPGTDVLLSHTHKLYKARFDEPFKHIITRSEFLTTKISMKEIIQHERFIAGYLYTRTNKGKKNTDYGSIADMWPR